MTQATRRDHPVKGVPAAAAFEAFNPVSSPKSHHSRPDASAVPVHPSTTVDQLSGRGQDNTAQRLPAAPIVANDPTGKRFDPVPSHSSVKGERVDGYTKQDLHGHGCAMALADEAVHSGSARLAGEVPHWRPNDTPECGD
jgi:hypothetical protein